MSFGKGKERAEEGIERTGKQMYERGKMLPEEQERYLASLRGMGDVESISRYLAGAGERPAGYTLPEAQYLGQAGDIGRAYYEQVLGEARDPYAYYQSALEPSLRVAEDYINRQAQQRGLIRSGIPIEQMGRAGVELAIQEAQGRMAAREAAMGRAGQMTQYIQQGAGERLANLSNLYAGQQQMGLSAMGRQAGVATAAAPYQAYPYQYQLGRQAGAQTGLWGLGAAGLGAVGTGLGAYYATKNLAQPTPQP